MSSEKIEPWFYELYKLAQSPNGLTLNEFYSEILKQFSKEPNNDYMFYSHEWPWGEEFDGCYVSKSLADSKIQALQKENAELKRKLDLAIERDNL